MLIYSFNCSLKFLALQALRDNLLCKRFAITQVATCSLLGVVTAFLNKFQTTFKQILNILVIVSI